MIWALTSTAAATVALKWTWSRGPGHVDHLQAKLRVQLEQAEAVRRAQEEEAERQRAEGVREMRRRVEAMREQMQLRATQLEKVRPNMPTRSAHAPTSEHALAQPTRPRHSSRRARCGWRLRCARARPRWRRAARRQR